MALDKPDETYSDDLYRFAWPDGYEMILERFNEVRDDIACELTVNSTHPVLGGTLVDGKRLLLIGPNSLRDMAKMLLERDQTPDWGAMLGQVTTLARRRYRKGEPAQILRDVPMDAVRRFLVEPFVLEDGVSMIYGDGGSCKSLLALTIALAVASGEEVAGLVAEESGPTMILDWEDSSAVAAERAHAIMRGCDLDLAEMPGGLLYRRMTTTLHEGARDLRKEIAERSVRFVVVDSLGMACGDDPNNPAAIIRTLTAARSLGVPVLVIHHIGKDQRDKSKPYGTVYASDEVRLSWFIERGADSTAADTRVALQHFKGNSTEQLGMRAFSIRFDNRSEIRHNPAGKAFRHDWLETLAIEALGDMATSAVRTPVQRWQIAEMLKTVGATTVKAISSATGIRESRIRRLLNEHPNMFVRIDGDTDKLARWGVTTDREEAIPPPRSPSDPGSEIAIPPPRSLKERGIAPTKAVNEEEQTQSILDDGWLGGKDGTPSR